MPGDLVIRCLDRIRRRVRLLSIAFGIGMTGIVALGLLLLTVLLDYLLNLPPAPRLFLLAVSAAVVMGAITRFIFRPAAAALSLRDVAARVELAFPQFDDRLQSAVNFITAPVPGSAAMQRRVLEQAEAITQSTDLSRAVVARPAFVSGSLLLIAAAFIGMLASIVGPAYRNAALSRLLTPFAGHPWPKSVMIQLAGDVPSRVAAGERLDLHIRVEKGDRPSLRAIVKYQFDDGPVQQELMARDADGSYSASLDAHVDAPRTSSVIRASISAGDDQLNLSPVTVVPRLAVKTVQATVIPPPYIKVRTPVVADLASAPLSVVAGSTVELRVGFTKPLTQNGPPAALEPAEPSPREVGAANAVAWSRDSDLQALGRFVAADSMRFRIRGTDSDGFSSDAVEDYDLTVRPDQPPTVQIDDPRQNLECTAQARIPLRANAEDDLGVTTVKLLVDRISQSAAAGTVRPSHWEIPLAIEGAAVPASGASFVLTDSTPQQKRYKLDYPWELGQLDKASLQPGDVLEYRLAAQDEFVQNGRPRSPVLSSVLRVTIISPEELATRVNAELSAIAGRVLDLRHAQGRTRQDTDSLTADTHSTPRLDPAADVTAQRLAGEESSEASGATELQTRAAAVIARLDQNRAEAKDLRDIAAEAQSILGQVAQGPMTQAAGAIGRVTDENAPDAANPKQRTQDLNAAVQHQQNAEDELGRLLARMNDVSSLADAVEQLSSIQAAQLDVGARTADLGRNNLGKTPEEMSPEDRAKLQQLADAQAKLSDRTTKAIAQMNRSAQQLEKTDPAAAAAMQKSAQQGDSQQVPPNQSSAANQMRDNKQSGAQSAQRAAEIGLATMLSELREAQQHKLEELSRKLAELQEQVAILIRRQAGHNLDNLLAQGPAQIVAQGPTVVDLATKAERPAPATQPGAAVPNPETPPARQADPQAQTEHNSRDLAKVAEDLPEGAEPSARLLRAAGRMERAVTPLRDLKLPDAYDPPQVEALAALESAREIIDRQKQKVDNQLASAQKEALRQRYAQLRQDQQRISADVTHIEKSRLPDSTLPRAMGVRLAQLPGEQGSLADRTGSFESDLTSLGSIVYVFANRDLVRQMQSAKDELGRDETGDTSQRDQACILSSIDDVIASLKVEPLVGEFAQEGNGANGGGGGSASPAMPSEAELRMLKSLQIGVNRGTVEADAIKPPDQHGAELAVLGSRQANLRDLLNQLLTKASAGKVKLGPEPANRDQLPEEAKADDLDDQELDKQLLTGKPNADESTAQANRVGDRMARSHQRLALNRDSGHVTQLVQARIITDLDDLIQQARKRESQTRNAPKSNPQQSQPPSPAPAQANNQGNQPATPDKPGHTAANSSRRDGPAQQAADLSGEIKQSLAEWGQVTPRLRAALVQGADESVLEPYRTMIEQYYKSLATQSSGQ